MDISENARITYEKRYLKKDEKGRPLETPADLLRRVAKNIAAVESAYGKDETAVRESENEFYRIMAEALFLPNSPTLMNAGRELQQLSACFVLPIEDSMEGIFTTLKQMALVQKTGGGTGFSFDRLRPSGDSVCSTNGVASGPLSFLKIFDAATEAVKQGGTRRGANMGSLIYNHPNIIQFICCKETEEEITNFNLSVAVSDEFMRKATGEDPDPLYDLINPRTGLPYRDPFDHRPSRLDAGEVFDLMVEKAWANGDPGIIFIDRMNEANPTPHKGRFETTNPCVPGDTFVLTAAGPRLVKELVGRGSTLIINGRPFKTGEAGFSPTGTKPLLLIKTGTGHAFRATADHLVLKVKQKQKSSTLLEKEWSRAADLKPGDEIMLHDHRSFSGWDGLYDQKEGYLAGLLVDDCTLKTGRAEPSAWLQPDADEIIAAATAAATAGAAAQPRRNGNVKQCSPVFSKNEYRLSLAIIRKIAFSLGIRPENKTITPYLETRTSSAFTQGFLRGLFDAAGFVQTGRTKSVTIRLPQRDPERLRAVQRMLGRCGIVSSIITDRVITGTPAPAPAPVPRKTAPVETEPRHELIIAGDNVFLFTERIGFEDTAKRNRLALALATYRRKPNRERFTAEIEAVLPGGTEPVYDVQVPGVNAFDANGVVVHNCGEQPLLPFEACCLGSINLGKFVTAGGNVDWDKLGRVVHTAVRFLDNAIDASSYVIDEIAQMHRFGNRKIGLGVMGWHDLLVRLGLSYDSEEALVMAEEVMGYINTEARRESVALAEERGVFPAFPGSIYDTGRPEDRVRNATCTTIAPTGTISILAGASSGIEPYFSIAFVRRNILGGIDLPEVNPVFLEAAQKEGFYSEALIRAIAKTGRLPEEIPLPEKTRQLFKTALEIELSWHIRHQAAFQKHTDNAVSKTINLRREAGPDEVRQAYLSAWKAGCKGITIYRDGSRQKQVLHAGTGPAQDDLKPTKRPKTLVGNTTSVHTALGNLFVTVNTVAGKPFELFAQIGKAGSDVVAFTEAVARLVSLALRCGVSVDEIVTQLTGIGGARSVGFGPNRIMSVPDAIGRALKELARADTGTNEGNSLSCTEICPECGTAALIRAEGCSKCEACGFSEC